MAKKNDWLAEMDAQTMANYQEIISDKARMSKAIKIAQARAKDLQKQATIMSQIGKKKKK